MCFSIEYSCHTMVLNQQLTYDLVICKDSNDCLTNSPALVRHMEMIPGIGDHDSAIKVDSMIKPMVSQCKPRKIYQYHKGDMTSTKV